MARLLIAIVTALYCTTTFADESDAPGSVLDQFDRTLGKEPRYASTPKYSLIVLGSNRKVKVWMVEDDKRLYVDRNANGDLTDDGPPIEPSDARQLRDGHWDFNYLLETVTTADGSQHTGFNLRRWNYGENRDSYGLSLSLDGQVPMYAGWFGTFWSTDAETAPVIHFGGPLTPQIIRTKDSAIGTGRRRLSIAFTTPGSGDGAVSRLSIDALAPDVVPKVTIDWPTASDSPPLRTSHDLVDRCCYWEFYTTEFEVPDGIRVGVAKLSVEFSPGVVPFELATTEIEVPVVARSRKVEE